ncbi:MAG: 4Fe-4S binding protein [Clostridia bacterium]|nr:4Fe-4S binding protein [Clostridia bacterium]
MSSLTPNQIMEVKGRGFLRNRGTDNFSVRIVSNGAVFTAEDFENIAKLAKEFGNGKTICTSRLNVEVPGIPYDKIPEAEAFAKEHGLRFGGTGAKIRPIAACKGTTCVFGNCDTHGIAKKLDEQFYMGWTNVKLPHKFKITVGGCPNSCMKPSLNDFGVEGHKIPQYNADKCRGCAKCAVESACPVKAAKVENGKLVISDKCITCGVCVGKCPFEAVAHEGKQAFKIFVGGTWGKSSRNGTPLSKLVSEEEIYPLLEKSILWYRENGYQKERFGLAIDRIGIEKFEEAIFSDELLKRKDEILAMELKTRE